MEQSLAHLFVSFAGKIKYSKYQLMERRKNVEEKGKPGGLNFSVCPNCKGKRFQANEVLKTQIEKGAMPKEGKAFLFVHKSLIAQGKNWLSAPIVVSFYDVCMDCGTVLCIHCEVATVVAGGKLPETGKQFGQN